MGSYLLFRVEKGECKKRGQEDPLFILHPDRMILSVYRLRLATVSSSFLFASSREILS